MIPTIELDQNGNVHTIYTDEINLYEIGTLHNVRRASNVVFNDRKQLWEVQLLDGTVIHEDRSREAAIETEVALLSPGGKHYCKDCWNE